MAVIECCCVTIGCASVWLYSTDSCEAAIVKLDLFIEIDTCDEYLHNFKCGDVFRYVQLIGKACVNW